MKMKAARSTKKVITGTTKETSTRSGPAVSQFSGEVRGVCADALVVIGAALRQENKEKKQGSHVAAALLLNCLLG
jgi:hypothetical protein